MTLQIVHADRQPPQAWRNGGGSTRELLCWPEATEWSLRVSVADIATDGPFSAYPGIDRWFAVIDGAGVALTFAEGERFIGTGDAPLRFDGAAAPACRLMHGPTRDLNLMLRGGQGVMRSAEDGVAWEATFKLRGLFTAGAGRWFGEGEERRLAANTLLWSDAASATVWTFEPDSPQTRAWWLGFTPGGPR